LERLLTNIMFRYKVL